MAIVILIGGLAPILAIQLLVFVSSLDLNFMEEQETTYRLLLIFEGRIPSVGSCHS